MRRNPDLEPGLPIDLKPSQHHGCPEWSPEQAAETQRQRVALKVNSPLQGRVDQDDESGLALFAHVDEGRLL